MKETEGYIIFVDDDREEHELFRMALAEVCDCKVISAYDGDEALKLIHEKKDQIFAVICDIRMSKMNGFELKRTIDQSPELKLRAIPFIFHSSSADAVIVKEAYALGIQGFIEKTSDIKRTVSTLIHFIRFWALTVHPSVYQYHIGHKHHHGDH